MQTHAVRSVRSSRLRSPKAGGKLAGTSPASLPFPRSRLRSDFDTLSTRHNALRRCRYMQSAIYTTYITRHFCNYYPRKVSRGSKLHNRHTTTEPRPPNVTQNKYRLVVRNTSRTPCGVCGHPPAAGSVAPALFPSPARPLRGMRSPRRARPLAFSLPARIPPLPLARPRRVLGSPSVGVRCASASPLGHRGRRKPPVWSPPPGVPTPRGAGFFPMPRAAVGGIWRRAACSGRKPAGVFCPLRVRSGVGLRVFFNPLHYVTQNLEKTCLGS